jgi:hypothetical protein
MDMRVVHTKTVEISSFIKIKAIEDFLNLYWCEKFSSFMLTLKLLDSNA